MDSSPYQAGRVLEPFPQCLDCLGNLAQTAADMAAGDDEALRQAARQEARQALEESKGLGLTSPEVANVILRRVRRLTGNDDPYREFKDRELASAKKAVATAARLAGGNLEDLVGLAALGNSLDFFKTPEQAMTEVSEAAERGVEFLHNDVELLDQALAAEPELVLYLTDNSGEIHFDLPLYQHVRGRAKRAVLVVKGGPALNDLTRHELALAGLEGRFDQVADTGDAGAGISWERVSPGFLDLVRRADLIIAKGMANFETICGHATPCPVFFIFRVKCRPMRDFLDAPPQSFWALWREVGRACGS